MPHRSGMLPVSVLRIQALMRSRGGHESRPGRPSWRPKLFLVLSSTDRGGGHSGVARSPLTPEAELLLLSFVVECTPNGACRGDVMAGHDSPTKER